MRLHQSRITTFALLIAVATQVAAADAPKPAKINVYPADVQLTTVRDRQSLIIQAEYADGITRDVTAESKSRCPMATWRDSKRTCCTPRQTVPLN
jgi:hypothetical protein